MDEYLKILAAELNDGELYYLEALVQSDYQPLGEELRPYHYRIVLTSGGPTVTIEGHLDESGAPETAELRYHYGRELELSHDPVVLEYSRRVFDQ